MVLLFRLVTTALLFQLCNAPLLPYLTPLAVGALVFFFLAVQIRPNRVRTPSLPRRLAVMMGGYELFLTSTWLILAEIVFAVLYIRPALAGGLSLSRLAASLLLTVFLLFLTLANGFFRILFTSSRLRLVLRALLILLWWCPVVNLILLWRSCSLVKSEYRFELARRELQELRRDSAVCKTRYPLVLVHGIFFRDWQLVNYWGRIPRELIRNGADVHYGGQQSSASIAESAAELRAHILSIVAETGCGKVNLIAHSKGGLDARYAITHLGLDQYVASLTTVNTPHRGCIFAQELLDRLPAPLVRGIAGRYNAVFHTLGDQKPDFLAGVSDLRADRCALFNRQTPDCPGVLYQSVMSTMSRASSAPFPLNLTYLLVKRYDREPNDGLVSLSSARWGRFLGNETVPGRRGISHGDIIDLMREDISGFDVREFYVRLVQDLKARGL